MQKQVILLKSILLPAQERKKRISCWVLQSLLLSSWSEMCWGAGAVTLTPAEAWREGWCCPAGQTAGLGAVGQRVDDVEDTAVLGSWSASQVSKELPPSALAPARRPGSERETCAGSDGRR